MRLKKYRIQTDTFGGYECRAWRLWFPFWIQMGFVNTHVTIEQAEEYIEKYKKVTKVVKYL